MAQKHINAHQHVLPTLLLTANGTMLFKLKLWFYNQQAENRISTPRLPLLSISSLSAQLIVHIVHFKLHLPHHCRALHYQTELTRLFRLLLPQHDSVGPVWLYNRISTVAVTTSPCSYFSMVECCRNTLKTSPSLRILLSAHTLQKIKTGLRKLTTVTQVNLMRENQEVYY